MDIKEVIQRIIYFRNKANLSARELSLRIGKHEGYINKLESKDFNLPAQTLLEIIDAVNSTPEEFFSNDYFNYKTNIELIETIKNLPLNKRSSLLNFIKG